MCVTGWTFFFCFAHFYLHRNERLVVWKKLRLALLRLTRVFPRRRRRARARIVQIFCFNVVLLFKDYLTIYLVAFKGVSTCPFVSSYNIIQQLMLNTRLSFHISHLISLLRLFPYLAN